MQLFGSHKIRIILIISIISVSTVLVAIIFSRSDHAISPSLENPFVILVNGQSNAISNPLDDQSCTPYEDPKIITFKSGQWYQANCDIRRAGFVGATWLMLAKKIVEQGDRTVVILNEAESGKSIAHFRPDSSNYTRLTNRVESAGITPDVIIFYQGETDGLIGTTTVEWQEDFEVMRRRYIDNPTFTQFILIQIQFGCKAPLADTKEIMIAQSEISNVLLISTSDIEQQDGCHLNGKGMIKLANRINVVIKK